MPVITQTTRKALSHNIPRTMLRLLKVLELLVLKVEDVVKVEEVVRSVGRARHEN